MKSFHERLDEARADIYTYHCKHEVSIEYSAAWIARLLVRNDGLKEQNEEYNTLTASVLKHNRDLVEQRQKMFDKLRGRQDYINDQFEKIKELEAEYAKLHDDMTAINKISGDCTTCDVTERLELMEGKVRKLRQTQGTDGDEIDELKRKLDAANTLLHEKDERIAELRKVSQQRLSNYEACFSQRDEARDALKNITSLAYGIVGKDQS